MNRRDVLVNFALAASGSVAARLVRAGALDAPTLPSHARRSALSAPQRVMIDILADLVIPETDTPGAIQAGVPEFIDQIVSTWYTPQERHIFLEGLTELDADCVKRFGRSFAASAASHQSDALSASEARSEAFRNAQGNPVKGNQDEPDSDSPFFYKLKELTVLGYYTSAVGSTTELNYNPVPGHFDGDIEFNSAGGRQWSS